MPTFNGEALTLGDQSALTPLVSVTLDAASNRGLYVTDSGAVNVTNANTTLTLNWPLKVKGTMEKWGPGTFALGGPLTLDGSCRMEIRQGAVQPLAQDALNGLTLSNAMHLSAFLGRPVEIPFDEHLYREELMKRVAVSRRKALYPRYVS